MTTPPRLALALLLLGAGARAAAQDCVPGFYNSEPRDSTWYYGVGKGADASLARKDALAHLLLKVSGGEPDVPAEALAGWEQDDHGECRGVHYVIDRIEKDRARANLARIRERKNAARPPDAAPAPAAPVPVVVHNNITVPGAPPAPRDDLKLLLLAACFVLALAAFVALKRRDAYAPVVGPSRDVVSEPKPRDAVKRDGALKLKFAAVARQPQAEAMSEIALSGALAYLKAHRGEGTCKSVPGHEELVRAGTREMAYRYDAQGWTVSSEPWSFYAVKADDGVAMGFGFFLYASALPGYVDCEILFAIGAPVESAYRKQMEEGLHEGLPWAVQAAVTRLGAAKTREDAS